MLSSTKFIEPQQYETVFVFFFNHHQQADTGHWGKHSAGSYGYVKITGGDSDQPSKIKVF